MDDRDNTLVCAAMDLASLIGHITTDPQESLDIVYFMLLEMIVDRSTSIEEYTANMDDVLATIYGMRNDDLPDVFDKPSD